MTKKIPFYRFLKAVKLNQIKTLRKQIMDLEDKLPLAPTNVKREEIFNQLQQLYLDHDEMMEGKYNKFL